MSHRFKRPKSFLNHGSPQARLRKSIERNIHTQEELDAFLAALPEPVRPYALERARPFLKFVPAQDLVETPKG